MPSPLSASGARIQGDDFQHLYGWYQAVGLLIPREDIIAVHIEAESAGNVDDVVVGRSRPPTIYCQVKYAVDATSPVCCEWWTKSAGGKSRSLLQKFWNSWKNLRVQGAPDLRLITNRAIDPNDPVMVLREGRHGRLVPRLTSQSPSSEAGKKRAELATHLGVSEPDMLEMFEHLTLITDQGPWSLLAEAAAARMGEAGLRADSLAVESGMQAARNWVTSGKRELNRKDVDTSVDERGLRAGSRRATLLVQAIDRDPWEDTATMALDWVDDFTGLEPRARREPADHTAWSTKFLPDLRAAAQRIRASGVSEVLVRGHMRLPTWFAAGTEFSDTAGWGVAAMQRGEEWSSKARAQSSPTRVQCEDFNIGADVAIGVSVTNEVKSQAVSYIQAQSIPIKRYCDVAPASGPARDAVRGADDAISLAVSIRQQVWDAVAQTRAQRVHLFLSCPAALALLLGHIWNRVPQTVTYEDLGPGRGYLRAFTIAG